MFEKVVVTFDGSEDSERALPYAVELASICDSELTIVGVCSEHERILGRLFNKYLEDLAGRLKKKRLDVKPALLYGNPAEEIIRYAREKGTNVIAMATHSRSGVTAWALGAVTEKVLTGTTTPLLLVPGKRRKARAAGPKLRRILVPLDGSPKAAAALPWARELAGQANARLFLLQVIPSTSDVVGVMSYAVGFEKRLVAALRQKAQEYVAGVAAELQKEKLDFRYDLAAGVPADSILDFARRNSVDLIVMSTHARAGVGRFILGSVTHQVVHSTDIPVLVVRARSDGGNKS